MVSLQKPVENIFIKLQIHWKQTELLFDRNSGGHLFCYITWPANLLLITDTKILWNTVSHSLTTTEERRGGSSQPLNMRKIHCWMHFFHWWNLMQANKWRYYLNCVDRVTGIQAVPKLKQFPNMWPFRAIKAFLAKKKITSIFLDWIMSYTGIWIPKIDVFGNCLHASIIIWQSFRSPLTNMCYLKYVTCKPISYHWRKTILNKTCRSTIIMIMLGAAFVCILIASVASHPQYRLKIPNGLNVPNPCPNAQFLWNGVGHDVKIGGGLPNVFGLVSTVKHFLFAKTLFRVNLRQHWNAKINSLLIIDNARIKEQNMANRENKVSWIYAGRWARENKVSKVIIILQYNQTIVHVMQKQNSVKMDTLF